MEDLRRSDVEVSFFCLGLAMPITLMLLLPIQGTISTNIMVLGSIAVCLAADSLMPHAVRFDSSLATALLLLRTLDRVHVLVEPSLTASDGDHEGVPVAIMEAMASCEHVTQRHSGVGRPWGKRIAFPAGDMAALAFSSRDADRAARIAPRNGSGRAQDRAPQLHVEALNTGLEELFRGLSFDTVNAGC